MVLTFVRQICFKAWECLPYGAAHQHKDERHKVFQPPPHLESAEGALWRWGSWTTCFSSKQEKGKKKNTCKKKTILIWKINGKVVYFVLIFVAFVDFF